jgi:uncharacterized membrane protein required for colicin V production
MTALLITLVLLFLTVLWSRGWLRISRLSLGIVVGAAVALACAPYVKTLVVTRHLPNWLPALPFALVAACLFGFGLLAWFWAED